MATTKSFVIPELFPSPKSITKLEGNSELSADVRLVTNNVSPLQRKAIRSILNDTGIRVVANKKKYVVEAKVEDASNFTLNDVPEVSRKDYYELELKGSEITIRAPEQDGTVWGTQTLAGIFRVFLNGKSLPNLLIRDWSTLPLRGIFVENKWGPDKMTAAHWFKTIDQMSTLKMNALGIGLYGCWGNCRFEGSSKPTEFLMVPVPGHEDAKTVHKLKWFSPEKNSWKKESYLPTMRENDTLLSDVISYASEHSITVIPFVNSFGHNTFFARKYPEISAKNEDGTPTGVGYCITSKKTRSFVEKFYTSIIDKYFPNGAEYFHVQMDEVWPDLPWPDEPTKVGNPWCQCKECKKKEKEQNLLDYVFWLVDMLTKHGVKKVVIWNDQLTRHMNAFDAKFVKRLEDAGLKDKLILHWWCYSNDQLNDLTRVSIGKKLGVDGWVAPMTCYFDWNTYDYRRPNIDLMMRMCDKEHACGAVSYAVHNPSHLDHEALLADYAWESTKGKKYEAVQKHWALSRFGAGADDYIKAAAKIQEAVTKPGYSACLSYSYTYSRADIQWPRPYPGEALEKLEAMEGAADSLKAAAALSDEADALLLKLLALPNMTDQDTMCLDSLRGEAARIRAYASTFAYLLELRQELADGMILKRMAVSTAKVRDDLVAQMAIVEKTKPEWVMPACMHALSLLLSFMNQLAEELKKRAGRKQAKQLVWTCPMEE